jgi:hypothetical protein
MRRPSDAPDALVAAAAHRFKLWCNRSKKGAPHSPLSLPPPRPRTTRSSPPHPLQGAQGAPSVIAPGPSAPDPTRTHTPHPAHLFSHTYCACARREQPLQDADVGTPGGAFLATESQEVAPPSGGDRLEDVHGCRSQEEMCHRVSHPTSEDGSVILRKEASCSGKRSIFVKTTGGVEVALDLDTLVRLVETDSVEGVEFSHVVACEGPFCGLAGWCKSAYVRRDEASEFAAAGSE